MRPFVVATLLWSAAATAATRPFAFTCDYPPSYDTAGYDVMTRLEVFRHFDPPEGRSHRFTWNGRTVTVAWVPKEREIRLTENGVRLATIELTRLVGRVREKYGEGVVARGVEQELLTLQSRSGRAHVRAYFEDVSGEETDDGPSFGHFKAEILVAFSGEPVRPWSSSVMRRKR